MNIDVSPFWDDGSPLEPEPAIVDDAPRPDYVGPVPEYEGPLDYDEEPPVALEDLMYRVGDALRSTGVSEVTVDFVVSEIPPWAACHLRAGYHDWPSGQHVRDLIEAGGDWVPGPADDIWGFGAES